MKILEYFFKNHNFDFNFNFQLSQKLKTIQSNLSYISNYFLNNEYIILKLCFCCKTRINATQSRDKIYILQQYI